MWHKHVRSQTKCSFIAGSVSVPVMLCLTLRILAGPSYVDLEWTYGIAESTIYHVLHETLHALNELLLQIRDPTSTEDCVAST